MIRILVLKRLYNLSDEQMECQLLDRMSDQRFCGLADSASIPDRTTIRTFEDRIGEAGAKALFDWVERQLLKQGYIARGGQIIDTTLVPAPKQHVTKEDKEQIKQDAMPADWSPAKRRQKDLDATWTRKHGKNHHGYKLSINVDKRYKMIRKIETDKAYPSAEREAKLKAAGYRNHMQRKGQRDHPLTDRQERRNRRIARTRARVERVFGAIAQMGGKLVCSVSQARANFAMAMMAICYNFKRLVYLKRGNRGLLMPEMGLIPEESSDKWKIRGETAQ
jgi:IS5 family transposase